MINLDQPEYKKIEILSQVLPDCASFAQGTLKITGVPKAIKEHAQSICKTDKADYYSPALGLRTFREKLAQSLSDKYKTNITSDYIMISHGSVNGISSLCLLLLNYLDEVILPEPTYPAYKNIVTLSKGVPVFIHGFKEYTDNFGKISWKLDIDAIEKATTARTKIIIIPNPSNPCGVCLTSQEIIRLKQWCENREIYLIIDEVYDNYIFQPPFNSSTSFVTESEFVIRTGSFSKDFAMSGWRIGFVVAPPSIITKLAGIQDGLICCPSVIGQYTALYALDHRELMKDQIQQVHSNCITTCETLEPLVISGKISFIKPSAGFFLFIKTDQKDTTDLVKNILDKVQVALVPGKDFGPSGYSYIRLCYARHPEVLNKGLERILNFFELYLP